MKSYKAKVQGYEKLPDGTRTHIRPNHKILARDKFHAEDEVYRIFSGPQYERVVLVRLEEEPPSQSVQAREDG